MENAVYFVIQSMTSNPNFLLTSVALIFVTQLTIITVRMYVFGRLYKKCLVEDVERNNGKDKPYFMDQDLLDLMKLKNERGKEEETALVEK